MTFLKITVCCVIHSGSQPNRLISFAVTSPQLVADVNVSLVGTITGLSNLRKTQPKKNRSLWHSVSFIEGKFYTCFEFLLPPKDGCTSKPCHVVRSHGVAHDIIVKIRVFHEQNIWWHKMKLSKCMCCMFPKENCTMMPHPFYSPQ